MVVGWCRVSMSVENFFCGEGGGFLFVAVGLFLFLYGVSRVVFRVLW